MNKERRHRMDKKEIVNSMKRLIDHHDLYGFEAYLVTDSEPQLKRLNLERNSLLPTLKEEIYEAIKEQYPLNAKDYANVKDVADNQEKYFMIEQDDDFYPFLINKWKTESFKEEHLNIFKGILFCFEYSGNRVWCYQNKRSITVTNRRKRNVLAYIKPYDNGVIFEEQKEKLVSFSRVVDMLIIDGIIITSNIKLLERSFEFDQLIKKKSKDVANTVYNKGFLTELKILEEYLDADVKSHIPYRKKMMKAVDSPILDMKVSDLKAKLTTVPRWKGVFSLDPKGKIEIKNYKDVKSVIDLFYERYTKSEVSDQEYDTDVKRKVKKK